MAIPCVKSHETFTLVIHDPAATSPTGSSPNQTKRRPSRKFVAKSAVAFGFEATRAAGISFILGTYQTRQKDGVDHIAIGGGFAKYLE